MTPVLALSILIGANPSGAIAMQKILHLASVPSGDIDTESLEIKFDLATTDGTSIHCTMKYGAATQIIGALGRMFSALQEYAQRQKGRMEPLAAEEIAAAHIQKDRWMDVVIFQLTTPQGVPYNFAMPPHVAADIADRLKIESAKPHQTGTA
jgi:hypothetical protein